MQYKKGNNAFTEWAYYEGSDTLGEGYCLCYNADYGTAANEDGERLYRVEKPSTTNNYNFAGVVHPDSAGKTGPCKVRIYKPGSACNVYAKVSATVNATHMAVCAGQYYMYKAGFPGTGGAVALQTYDRSSTAGLVQALLETGPQSGGVEQLTVVDNAAVTPMVGGISYVAAATLGTGNCTATVAAGTFPGQQKAFICEGTLTTSDLVVTFNPAPYEGSSYDVATMDAANEYVSAEFNGVAWHIKGGNSLG